MHACTMRCSGVATAVIGVKSRVSVEDTDFAGATAQDGGPGAGAGMGPGPIYVYGVRTTRGSALLRRCTLARLEYAVAAVGRTARLEVHETSIEDCAHAIQLMNRARGTVAETRVHACEVPGRRRSFPAFQAVRVEGARAQITRCEVHVASAAAVTTSVEVCEGGRGVLHLCRLVSEGCGLNVGDSHTHTVASRCEVAAREICCVVRSPGSSLRVCRGMTSQGVVCLAHNHATLMVADTRMKAGTKRLPGGPPSLGAVTVDRGGAGHLVRCRIHESLIGVHVEGGRLRAKDTDVFKMVVGMAGEAWRADEPLLSQAYIWSGGHVDIEGGSIVDCLNAVRRTNGDPRRGNFGPGSLRMHGVTLKQYSVGLIVAQECTGEVAECRFVGHGGMSAENRRVVAEQFRRHGRTNQFLAAVVFHLARRGSVRDCEFDGNDRGLTAGAEEGIQIERCTFCGPVQLKGGEDCIRLTSEAAVEYCLFTAGACAVLAKGSGAVCMLRRCKIAAGVDTGVAAVERARVTSVNCEVHSKPDGFAASRGGAIAAQDCVCEGVLVGLRVAAGGGTVSAKRVKVRAGEFAVEASHYADAPGTGSGVSTDTLRQDVKLVECDLSGEQAAVAVTGPDVDISLLRCEVMRSLRGVIMYAGAEARVRNSSFSDCSYGIMIGEREEDLRSPCDACGRTGEAALMQAWEVRTTGQQSLASQQGGVCAHTGARARAKLNNLDFRGCSLAGVMVSAHGHVAAHAVRVVDGKEGIEVVTAKGAERSRFSDCTVAGFRTGDLNAVVAKRQWGPGADDVETDEEYEGIRVVDTLGAGGVENAAGEEQA